MDNSSTLAEVVDSCAQGDPMSILCAHVTTTVGDQYPDDGTGTREDGTGTRGMMVTIIV